jgi:ATP-binding cassette subfamily B protein
MKNKTLNRVLSYVGKYKYLLPVSIFFALTSVIATLFIPLLIGRAIDFIVGKGDVDFEKIVPILFCVLALIGIGALSTWLMSVINNRITYKVSMDVKNDAFEKIRRLPTSYLDNTQSGDILNRITSDTEQLSEGLLLGFTQLFTGVLTIVGTLAMLVIIDWRVAAAVFILTPLSLFVSRFIAKRVHNLFVKQSKAKAENTSYINEMIREAKLVRAFSYEREASEKFSEKNGRLTKISTNAIFFSSLVNPSTRFVNSIVYAACALIGSFLAIGASGGAILIGELSSLLAYANQYTKPFNEISGVIAEFQGSLASAERVFQLLDEKEETESADACEITDVKGDIKFTDVYFSYTPEKPLLTGINLSVFAGKRVAIVGPTGCGKTTLINLLMRFYDVSSGEISLDGKAINEIKRKSLRRSYGMVLQDTWLSSGTVADIIAMGKPNALREEITEAARLSHADGFIKRLPNGYDTYIGEGGIELSAGQKQLLSIARVMINIPPMLILDEATSNIDTRTEMKINAAFSKMMEGRTSFIVAHRLSTIINSDIILVMNDGNIVESGTHSELIALGGFYSQLYNSSQK